METWTDDDGVVYISCDWLCVGDYGGAGSIGEANIRALEDREDALVRYGAYSSRQLWLTDSEEARELIDGLESSYPLVDDDSHSDSTSEWEDEAWESYGRYDLTRTLPDGLQDVDDSHGIDLWECYCEAMDSTNSYPTMEYNGASLPIDRIKDAYALILLRRVLPDDLGRIVGDDLTDATLWECWQKAEESEADSTVDAYVAAILTRLARLA